MARMVASVGGFVLSGFVVVLGIGSIGIGLEAFGLGLLVVGVVGILMSLLAGGTAESEDSEESESPDVRRRLSELDRLHDDGILDDDEHARARQRVLDAV